AADDAERESQDEVEVVRSNRRDIVVGKVLRESADGPRCARQRRNLVEQVRTIDGTNRLRTSPDPSVVVEVPDRVVATNRIEHPADAGRRDALTSVEDHQSELGGT